MRCECDECAPAGQFALETRAFVKAWQIARQQFPELRIRILTTQGSYDSNDKVLAEAPPEVGVDLLRRRTDLRLLARIP